MKKLIFALALIAASPAMADSGSTSGSCSGTLPDLGYYYAYTYQYIYTYNGQIQTENHNFNFSGFLSGMEKARMINHDEKFVYYRGDKYTLAVPYRSDSGLFLKQKRPNSPDDEGRAHKWIKLCDY
jgi:hypothetical protein